VWLPRFRLSAEHLAFRDNVRAFLLEAMAPDSTEGHRDPRDLTGWEDQFERDLLRRAGDAGLLGISLPEELGGDGRPPSWQAIVTFESAYRDAPLIDTAAVLVAPSIVAFGTTEQQNRIVRAAVRGTINACIAYSEADAGSDLANIATTARSADNGYVLDGEKVLVTGAHKADWCCTIARTDPESTGRRGLSMFVLDMRTPGVEIERVPTANRWTLATVRFDQVRVGSDALLGQRDDGWRQLTAALLGERSGAAWLGWATRDLEMLLSHCAGTTDQLARAALGDLVARLAVAIHMAQRVLALQDAGKAPIVDGAMSKVLATELLQRISRVGAQLIGTDVLRAPGWFAGPLPQWFSYELVERLHPTLSVGANEVQRTTIGQVGLGLPAE
jgi:3-oxocholest-4-en-26-oyl-CoA dehydrogenase alpha subunit